MRLATITNWAYGTTVTLTLASAISMLLASGAQEAERAAVTQRYTLDQASTSVAEDVSALSDQAQGYVITGSDAHLAEYRQKVTQLRSVEDRLQRLRDVGAQSDELEAIAGAMRRSDGLLDEQHDAIESREHGDEDAARRILFGPDYYRELERIDADVERFQYRLDQRTNTDLNAAIQLSKTWKLCSEIMLGLTGLLFLFVLYFVFKQRVLRPVVRLSDVVKRMTAHDYADEPPTESDIDEIGDLSQALRLFRQNALERHRLEQDRNAEFAFRSSLSRMTQRMQECENVTQLEQVIENFMQVILPSYSGRLFFIDDSGQTAVESMAWQGAAHTMSRFSTTDCWALQRNEVHRPHGVDIDVPCKHLLADNADRDSICLPITSQHSTLGLVYLERVDDSKATSSAHDTHLRLLADSIGLSLGNLKLRERLRALALQDPLTGLANRRHMDQALEASLAEAEQMGNSISCLMIDIDHFKRTNDSFGHEAGDMVLRQVGAVLMESARGTDLLARYGGEEFLLLAPELPVPTALMRAESLRQAVRALRIHSDGQSVGEITVSVGVATAPEHCSYATLVKTADAALYRAKAAGRNCIVEAIARSSDERNADEAAWSSPPRMAR